MKTLSANQSKKLNALTKSFNKEIDANKKDLLQKEIIASFGEDNFNDALKAIAKKIDAPKVDAPSNDALSNSIGESELEINSALLNSLNAIGITDKLKEKSGKSIFKSEFNNKADRTKCRNKFQNLLSLYLLQLAHNKVDKANELLAEIKSIAIKYYIAEDAFKSKSEYCTDNMDADKKSLIELFISTQLVEA